MGVGKQVYEQEEIARLRPRLSARLKEAMGTMSLAELAYHTAISETSLRAYLLGRRLPRIPQLVIIARVLDCSTDWLLDTYDDEYQPQPLAEPTHEEQLVLMAIAVSNDAGTAPGIASIARFTNLPSRQVTRLIRRLQAADWVDVEQRSPNCPISLRVTSAYTDWFSTGDKAQLTLALDTSGLTH